MNRHLKTRLHLVKPAVGRKLTTKQTREKTTHDRHGKVRIFKIGDFVYALRYHDDKASWVGTRHHRTTNWTRIIYRVTTWYYPWRLHCGWYIRGSRVRIRQSQKKPPKLSRDIEPAAVIMEAQHERGRRLSGWTCKGKSVGEECSVLDSPHSNDMHEIMNVSVASLTNSVVSNGRHHVVFSIQTFNGHIHHKLNMSPHTY